ncbi:hypothetical protein CANTEDRAFT_113024 [Yamadazyma tenuis ATCC 10573]|nr:uncharacterized protein CANTEDRAFT_113024 [Yamadazyma tenuis ATCC 10573]EGV65493.1 hypothetical protein CANTEDRAFT_113024 [Yamadazyma tenuis ATCC 10573]
MSFNDEYSSDDDESIIDRKSTNVHLGFLDIEIPDSKDGVSEENSPTIEDTILGGQPVWLHPDSLPAPKLVTCDSCGQKMALYLQAFAPFKERLYDRVLYILGCTNTQQCSKKKGTVKAIRGIIKDPVKMADLKREQENALQKQLDEKLQLEAKTKLRDELTKNLFGNSKAENPFAATGSNPFTSSNPFDKKVPPAKEESKSPLSPASVPAKPTYSSVAGKNVVAQAKTASPKYTLPEYPGYFVYVEKEHLKKITLEPELEKYKHLIDSNSIEEEEPSGGSTSTSAGVLNAQASKISNMLQDTVFENFTNTVQHNPGQVLRYDLGGKPLLYNGKDDVCKRFGQTPFNIPNPGYNPSSSRQFEIQVMPKAILDLENAETADLNTLLNGMSWGTIIVCTDVEDYMPEESFDENHVAYIEEYCAVQWEESV